MRISRYENCVHYPLRSRISLRFCDPLILYLNGWLIFRNLRDQHVYTLQNIHWFKSSDYARDAEFLCQVFIWLRTYDGAYVRRQNEGVYGQILIPYEGIQGRRHNFMAA